jgi:sterol desaturase/sphingolipid hydroxylase (fatty acid hydroxylase superfamily)
MLDMLDAGIDVAGLKIQAGAIFSVFLFLLVVELIYMKWRLKKPIPKGDIATNIFMQFGYFYVSTFFKAIYVGVYFVLYEYRLFDLPNTGWVMLGALFFQDFLYYCYHRTAHRVRWLWAAHSVHHSSTYLNYATSGRLPWSSVLSLTWIFWTPMVLLGVHPLMVAFVVSANLTYQFFQHTEYLPKLGPLEWIINTPSHHRVHHATNPQYLDRNYGGVLIIWDRMFGTFCAEDEKDPCKYGLVTPVLTKNPVMIQLHEYINIFRDMIKPHSLRIKLGYLFGPPGWSHDGSRMTTQMIQAKAAEMSGTQVQPAEMQGAPMTAKA